MHEATESNESAPTRPAGPSIWAILRRRWWLIAGLVVGAVAVTLLVTLSAPPTYRSSLRLQALALDDQEVALYTRRSSGGVSEQIALTQFNFNETLQNSLIAWRTIRDLDLDLSANQLLGNLSTSAAGDFVTVTYDAATPQEAMDVLNRHVENALAYYNEIRARPASVSGQFVTAELATQGQRLRQAQDALLQFQLEHNVGDLPREINAVQDGVRAIRTARDAAQVQASLAETLAEQHAAQAAETEAELAAAQQALAALPADGETLTAEQQASREAQLALVTALSQAAAEQRGAARAQEIAAAGQRAVAVQQESLLNQRAGDLAQLIGLSSDYSALQASLDAALADYDFLRSKAAEARLKEAQAISVGSLQVVDPAFLPGEPGDSSALRLTLLVAVVSLLFGLVIAMLLEFVSPTPAQS
ncbi:MAG TPA: Wzz/FepE/Etk N-terminal domain-containing protein [Anaerolineae bacterium]|nr:Wzz/FepE/Etk N-terminal domain-containing protein [Anaerolineae bacterium]